MDRINGADTIDIGGGRRGFRDENLAAGTAGTEVTALHLNSVQEEILKVITEAGLAPSDADWTQLWQALQIFGLAPDRSRRWLAVISMTLSSAPGAPAVGDAYLIPVGATGIWSANVGKIAQWTGSTWSYQMPTDGHGISLPDGRVFERIAGVYVEKIALDAQSGKWSYFVATGTANALTGTLNPSPSALAAGLSLVVKVLATNTGAATLNLNGLGAKPIRYMDGRDLFAGELTAGQTIVLRYTGTEFIVASPTVAFERLTPKGGRFTEAFTANVALADMTTTGYLDAQSVTISGATYIDAIGYVQVQNTSATLADCAVIMRLLNGGTLVTASAYLGASSVNSMRIPVTIKGRFVNLDPAITYTLKLSVQKSTSVGPYRAVDTYIGALSD